MVKIKKPARSSESRPVRQARASKPEVIDLDEESDKESNYETPKKAPASKIIDISETPESNKKLPIPPKKKAPSLVTKPPSLKKKQAFPKTSDSNTDVTAQEVLDKIPSLDLSSVHVKENVKFDFKNAGTNAELR